ncbi:probable cation-transporting ATPase 13A4 isoform X1 [Hylobates moloch]|uniref:probable cation-transporting ATPase 13A4 isoform X1 n=1 Tax=Hylobates moloch TaxID=81572 RepID=UPI00267699BF|nr:probable cation-transporting ATPase 13A4 isoform X1 [Hylobates moloch]XP_058291178.1 probable cation-transporting ATPase 13A4 isoform X1 [Hylobates moloch]
MAWTSGESCPVIGMVLRALSGFKDFPEYGNQKTLLSPVLRTTQRFMEMAFAGDDFHIKGVPAHAMVVKPCRTASQVPVEGIAILHQFPFSSALQRMTVIVQEMGGDRLAFMKGAPERVASFCQPETGL